MCNVELKKNIQTFYLTQAYTKIFIVKSFGYCYNKNLDN